MRSDFSADFVVDALGMAVTLRKSESGRIHHFDRGSRCDSLAFGKTQMESGIMPSMGIRVDPHDNAAAPCFFTTIKTELNYQNTFKIRNQERLAVFRYIEGFDKPVKRHSAWGYMSPASHEIVLEGIVEIAAAAAVSKQSVNRKWAIRAH